MPITQRSGGRSIVIKNGKVTINGHDVSPAEAEGIKQEGLTKLKQAMHAAKPSPQKGDSVVVVNAAGVHVFGKGVTIHRK